MFWSFLFAFTNHVIKSFVVVCVSVLQVTVLLKECQDIQLRCGATPQVPAAESLTMVPVDIDDGIDARNKISESLVSNFSFQTSIFLIFSLDNIAMCSDAMCRLTKPDDV